MDRLPMSDWGAPTAVDFAIADRLAAQIEPPISVEARFSVEQHAVFSLARAYLALRATPAPSGEAEPVAWAVVEDTDRRMSVHLTAEAARQMASVNHEMNTAHEYAVQPLYDRATPPSVPQVTEEMVEAGVQGWSEWANNGREDDETVSGMVRAILTAALTPQPKEGR